MINSIDFYFLLIVKQEFVRSEHILSIVYAFNIERKQFVLYMYIYPNALQQ